MQKTQQKQTLTTATPNTKVVRNGHFANNYNNIGQKCATLTHFCRVRFGVSLVGMAKWAQPAPYTHTAPVPIGIANGGTLAPVVYTKNYPSVVGYMGAVVYPHVCPTHYYRAVLGIPHR